FWSTPLPGIRDVDDLFCFNSVFGAPLCLGSEILTTFFCSNSVFRAPICPGPDISTTFFCFNSVFGASLCPLTRDFDDLFQNFFFHNRLYILREQWRLLNPAAPAVAGERRPRSPRSRGGTQTLAGALFQRTFFRGVFCNGIFQRALVVQLTGFATGFRRANGFFFNSFQ